MTRFDEVELELEPLAVATDDPVEPESAELSPAPRFRRLLALLTDLSLFAALALALSPLLPAGQHWLTLTSLAGFVVVISYYYFVGTWLLWGKTVGGAIFDVKVVAHGSTAMAFRSATLRWAGVYLSLLTCGLGFALAALPSRRSLPDRMSGTACIAV
jgi:uncharacterized RDD family membrane protein YckC